MLDSGVSFVSGSMSVEGSVVMGGVELRAPRGAPNVSYCTHSGLAQWTRWGCMCGEWEGRVSLGLGKFYRGLLKRQALSLEGEI